MSELSEKVMNLPAVPGVYLFKDATGRVLYVGKAKSLAHRVRNYLAPHLADPRLRELMARAVDLDTVLTDSEGEALLAEASLIRQYRPRFNIRLTDDKSFPYVKLSVQEEFPRLSVTRHVQNDGARYLGPFTDVKGLRRALREIRQIFPVRTCHNFEDHVRADRPCLYYHIRRCVGPCTRRAGVVPGEYRALVDQLILFLTGRDDELLRRLRSEMELAAAERRFETAARRRDQIRLLESARRPQNVVQHRGADTDVLGLARHGRRVAVAALIFLGGRVVGKECRVMEGAESLGDAEVLEEFLAQHYLARETLPRRIAVAVLSPDATVVADALARRAGHKVALIVPQRGRGLRLVRTAERNAALALEDLEARRTGRRARFSSTVLELQRALELPAPPFRMVCFDISNLGAEGAVAAVVASENGEARKGLYRRMRIRHPGPDDFAMIREAVGRYWAHVESGDMPRPDLVVVDGGAGQVSAARTALDQAATAPVPLIGIAKREETVVREAGPPLRLPRRSAALRGLQRLRDEAHRFGLAYHRGLRRKARLTSELDHVPGVGPARRAALLKEFGSLGALRAAPPEELVRRAHISPALAERVARALSGAAENAGEAGGPGRAQGGTR